MKKLVFLSLLGLIFLKAEESNPLAGSTFAPPTPQQEAQNPNAAQDLKIKQFYLNMPKDQIHEVIKKDKEVKEALDRFDDVIINSQPEIRAMSSQDSVMVHPYFTTTFLLPTGSQISFVDSSAGFEVLKFQENTLMYRPKKDFDTANLSILYSLNKQNHVFNIIVKRYEKSADNQLNLVISYKDIPKRSSVEVLQAYIKEYGYLPKDEFSYIYLDDILYRIVQDDKYGNLMIDGKKYRIDNQKIYK